MKNGTGPVTDAVEIEELQDRVHTVVIDCSTFTFIDSVGLHALPSVSINNASTFTFLIMSRDQFIT